MISFVFLFYPPSLAAKYDFTYISKLVYLFDKLNPANYVYASVIWNTGPRPPGHGGGGNSGDLTRPIPGGGGGIKTKYLLDPGHGRGFNSTYAFLKAGI